MAGIARLAWRNLGRNRRRTFITGTALAIGVALSVAAYGWTDGMLGELLRSLTRLHLGHVQVHHPDYPRTRSSEHAIAKPERVLAAASALDGVTGAAPRVYSFALVSNQGKSLGVELIGVDPVREPTVTVLHERMVQGSYLDAGPTPWPRGRALTPEERARDQALTEQAEDSVLDELEALEAIDATDATDAINATDAIDATEGSERPPTQPENEPAQLENEPAQLEIQPERARQLTRELALTQSPPPERPPGALIGASLARILDLEVGDRFHATGQTTDGQTEEAYFQVAGIFRTGAAQFDRTRMYLHMADLQRFIHLYDQVHEFALLTTSPERAGAVAQNLAQVVDDSNVLVRSWQEIRPDISRMLEVSQASAGVMVFIIYFVAVLGVINTMLMSVFERTRELGVLKAIGMSGGRIVTLIVTETLFLVLLAAAAGTVLGLGLDLYMVEYGIDLSSATDGFTVAGVGIDPVIHGAITARGVIMPTVILSIMCLVASLYPAIRAARLRPAVGMRDA